MKPSCVFCGSGNRRVLLVTTVGESLFCGNCGGVQNRNKSAPPAYPKEYFQMNYASREAEQKARFHGILEGIQPLVRVRRILDVGCGTGLLLKVAHTLGYQDGIGIDAHMDAVEIAKQTVQGTDVAVFSKLEDAPGRFGVISFMDSIGHIEHLEKTFPRLIEERLVSQGLLVVKTPHFSKTYFRYGQLLGWLLRLVGKADTVSEEVFFLPKRYFLFTEAALNGFLQRHGLNIISRSIQSEYHHSQPPVRGLKASLFHLLFRHVPKFFWGEKTMVIVAQKEL